MQINYNNSILDIYSIPKLPEEYKAELKVLATEYFSSSSKFIYDGSFRRESYAYPNTVSTLNGDIDGCMYNGKYIINCNLFAQFIWMGRSICDFKKQPCNEINTAFDWGYYFDFKSAKRAYGVKKTSSYYSANTYELSSGKKAFITFDNAAAMAQELYMKGYEIPYSKADIGDLIFYRSENINDGTTDNLEQSSFRYITHVGVVYDVTADGLTIIESSSAYAAAIGKCGLGDTVTRFGNVRAAGQEQRVVMAARHPAAWGHTGNVPRSFECYRGVEVQ